MEDAFTVHVVNGLDQLPHVVFDPRFWQILSTAFYRVVQIHVHQFEDKSQAACGFIVQHFVQFDDLGVRR
jgi:hypothetical protein